MYPRTGEFLFTESRIDKVQSHGFHVKVAFAEDTNQLYSIELEDFSTF